MPSEASFDLTSCPWLPVRLLDGGEAEMSLREVFEHAGSVRRLVGDVPTQEFALIRLLLAIVHDALQGPGDIADWNDLRSAGLPVKKIIAYLDEYRHRFDLLHPTEPPRQSHVETCLNGRGGPVVAATDYMRLFADQIRTWVPGRYRVLGTDGFGRSDYRRKLRHFFEVDRHWVTVAALKSLAEKGAVEPKVVADAILKYGIDCEKPNPMTV